MRTLGKLTSQCVRVLGVVLLAALVVPAARSDTKAENRIKNFGRVNQNYYRGGRPKGGDYASLASIGIKTVIDLERGGEADEKRMVEQAGMKFYRIPLSDTAEPTKEQVQQFLNIVSDSRNQPVYLHCRAGRHRTGAMTAIYRMAHDGWTADRAYAEMKEYEFKKGTGHGALKKCVYEYSTSATGEKK